MVLENITNAAETTAKSFVGDPAILIIGIVLIIAAAVIFLLLKQIIVNSILGLIVFGIAHFVFGVQLPFIPTLIVTAVFGLAGIGVMLLLKFLAVL